MTRKLNSSQGTTARLIKRNGIALALFAFFAWAVWPDRETTTAPVTPDLSGAIERQSIYGEISHPNGTGIQQGFVRLIIRSRPYPGGVLSWRGSQYYRLDSEGSFKFGLTSIGLERGSTLQVALHVHVPGLMPVFEERQVTIDQLPLHLDLTPELGPGVYGRAVNVKGHPLAETRIRFGKQEMWTNDAGMFSLSIGAQNTPGEIQISHPLHGAAEPVPIKFESAVRDLGDIHIDRDLGTISGQITYADGKPVESLQLELQLIAADGENDPRSFDQVKLTSNAEGEVRSTALRSGFYRLSYADPGTELGLARLLGEGWHLRKRTGSTPFSVKLPYACIDFHCVDVDGKRLDSVVRVAVWEDAAATRAQELFERNATMPDELLAKAVVLSDDFHPGRLDRIWAKPQSFVAFLALNGPAFQPTHAATFIDNAATKIELIKTATRRSGDFGTLKLTALDASGLTISPAIWRVEMARIGGIVGFSREDRWIGNGVHTERGTAELHVVPGALKIRVEVAGQRIGNAEITVGPGETKDLSITLSK